MAISLAQAKQLCTAAELQLVRDSLPPRVQNWTETQLKSKIARARQLRDKWRDQKVSQRRAAQKQAAHGQGQIRSLQKAELFGEVLSLLEAQRKSGNAATADSAGRTVGKRKRSFGHRQVRAAVRQEMKTKRTSLKQNKKSSTASARSAESSGKKSVKKATSSAKPAR